MMEGILELIVFGILVRFTLDSPTALISVPMSWTKWPRLLIR